LVFKVWTTSILKIGENSSAKGLSQTILQTGTPAHDVARATPRRLAVPGLRAHVEAPE
jgi:hypothetical protein